MEIIKRGNTHEITCEHCGTQLKWTVNDLMWRQDVPDYFYINCPECNAYLWVRRTEELDKQWDAINNPALNPYATPNPWLLRGMFNGLNSNYKQTN